MMMRVLRLVSVLLMLAIPMTAQTKGGIESSYHGQMGRGTGLGMLEKWEAMPNFSFEEQGGIYGWVSNPPCNDCHIGASWNPTKTDAQCNYCHDTAGRPSVAGCVRCHKKDTEKRGDLFTADADVHIANGMLCQDCHVRMTDPVTGSDHQFAKGTVIDTTEPSMKGTLACIPCHDAQPHTGLWERGVWLDDHLDKVACETCHTGARPAWALWTRDWSRFTSAGTPVSKLRTAGWMPTYKWYDGKGSGAAGNYLTPILGVTERRNAPGAKIYPFNVMTITWFVKTKKSPIDDIIVVPAVKAADANRDGITTPEEMRAVYPQATLLTKDLNFNISHSIGPSSQAFACNDCHGKTAWVLDWKALGYKRDPNTLGINY
jgi:methanogenesis multiheme c-type cytochrome